MLFDDLGVLTVPLGSRQFSNDELVRSPRGYFYLTISETFPGNIHPKASKPTIINKKWKVEFLMMLFLRTIFLRTTSPDQMPIFRLSALKFSMYSPNILLSSRHNSASNFFDTISYKINLNISTA
jgi:hypothetical protein